MHCSFRRTAGGLFAALHSNHHVKLGCRARCPQMMQDSPLCQGCCCCWAKATQTCIHGLLEQTCITKNHLFSGAVQRENGVVMKGELMLWPHVEVSIPRLGQSYRTLVSAPGPASPLPVPSLSPLGFLCAGISFFL